MYLINHFMFLKLKSSVVMVRSLGIPTLLQKRVGTFPLFAYEAILLASFLVRFDVK